MPKKDDIVEFKFSCPYNVLIKFKYLCKQEGVDWQVHLAKVIDSYVVLYRKLGVSWTFMEDASREFHGKQTKNINYE